MRSETIIKIMFLSLIFFSIYSMATANPFDEKAAFEVKKYDDRLETALYKNPLHLDQMDEFTELIVKYMDSLGYDKPLGIRVTKSNLKKYIDFKEFLTWKKGSETVVMCIYKNPKIKDTYLVSFKFKDVGVKARYKR